MNTILYLSKRRSALYALLSLLIIPLLISLSSCTGGPSEGENQEDPDAAYKLPSTGGTLEIILVMDSSRWKGDLGSALKDVFMDDLPGIPRSESRFKLIQILPSDFNRFLKRHNNVMFVTVLNDNTQIGRRMKSFFTQASLNSINEDPNKFMIGKSDQLAVGQKSLFLFGKTEQDLIVKLGANKENLREFFYRPERARLLDRLLGGGAQEQKQLNKKIEKETGLSIRIPSGYQVARIDSNFMWLRRPGEPIDRSITITYGNYSAQEMFDDSEIVRWRNYFGYKYMNDTTLNQSYMHTQDDVIPIVSKNVNMKGGFAKEYRGLWKLKNNSRGGPFLGYAFVDDKNGKFFYVEGFIYGPNQKHKLPMFELESILRTARVNPNKQ